MKTYLVGGAVRDTLLGITPQDHDWVIVGATADDVRQLIADGYEQVGADFPVFLHPTTKEEHALARTERKVGVGYGGFETEVTGVTIEQDLARRDLTINSMAMDSDGTLIDPFHGQQDLHNHVLRHTTQAFAEDPLRVLRLARFAGRFRDWTIHPSTVELCKRLTSSGELNHLSIERVWTELDKGLQGQAPDVFLLALVRTGAIASCPVLTAMMPFGVENHHYALMRALKNVPTDHRLSVGVACLFANMGTLVGESRRVREAVACRLKLTTGVDTAADVLDLLKMARALKPSTTFNDLLYVAQVYEQAGFRHLTNRRLEIAAETAKRVTASQFTETGPALGDAIRNAQIDCIAEALDLRPR